MLKKILHVDDDEDIRDITRIALEDIGDFQVYQCASGEQALRECSNITPDAVVLDVMMPGMSGETTYEKLREIDHMKDIPIVFMTAKAERTNLKELFLLGANGVVQKPFDPLTLADEIRALCIKSV